MSLSTICDEFDIAKKFIDTAKNFCNVKHIKFQKRNNKELLSKEMYNAPHPNPENSYGETYGKHREHLELDIHEHKELNEYCNRLNITYSCSVWDLTSAKEISALNPKYIKVPSATNCNFQLLEYLCENYQGQIHLSLGMTTKDEELRIIGLFEDLNRLKDLVLY